MRGAGDGAEPGGECPAASASVGSGPEACVPAAVCGLRCIGGVFKAG